VLLGGEGNASLFSVSRNHIPSPRFSPATSRNQPQRVYSVRISFATAKNCCGYKQWNMATETLGEILRSSLGKGQITLTTVRERLDLLSWSQHVSNILGLFWVNRTGLKRKGTNLLGLVSSSFYPLFKRSDCKGRDRSSSRRAFTSPFRTFIQEVFTRLCAHSLLLLSICSRCCGRTYFECTTFTQTRCHWFE